MLKKWLKGNMTWVYFTLALIFILFPNTSFSPFNESCNNILEKIGFVALTSGVFAGVLKSIQFSGLFREELTTVISGDEFLKNRKDLPELWKKISKIIYSEKFPEISSLLEDRILTTYFPMDSNHYNEDVVISIVIHSLSDDLTINYTQTVEYFAVLDINSTKSLIQYSQTITDNENVTEKNELVTFKIEGVDYSNNNSFDPTAIDGKIVNVYSAPIEGKRRSKVELKFNSEYSLKGENFKLLRFSTITKNVDLTVSHPENVEVSFFNIGVITKFEQIHTDIKHTVSRRHRDDLILPKQGFGLSFNRS